jgi:hypothetical protein
MKKYFVIILLFSAAVICYSQNSIFVNGAQLYTISGELYNNESCEVKFGIYALNNYIEPNNQNCTVKGGRLYLSIPDTIEDGYLSDHNLLNGIKSTNLGIRFADSIGSGVIIPATRQNDTTKMIEISFIYSDRNAAILTPTLWDGSQKTVNYKKGWNILEWHYCEVFDTLQSLYNRGYKWYVFYFNQY